MNSGLEEEAGDVARLSRQPPFQSGGGACSHFTVLFDILAVRGQC